MSTAVRPLVALDNSFAHTLPELCVPWSAAPSPVPRLLAVNAELARELGIDVDALQSAEGLGLLDGTRPPVGSEPVAMAYSGHQFGGFSPRLGDGRALLLGELIDAKGQRRDLHLKGSGRTPFSRGGDGKAAVGPMLREYLVGEAMHSLGIPTTRALGVVATGDEVVRDTMLPGAVLARVAASHLRVGTFQYAAGHDDPTLMQRLADYAIARHYPDCVDTPNPYLAFFDQVMDAQASLLAKWMNVGFIHGVMNTDNMTISGETIDYGPCAFMEAYEPATVFSSIDHGGRYAYGNQPQIAQWNLARLAEALLPLFDPDTSAAIKLATELLEAFPDRYSRHWRSGMRAKLGLTEPLPADDELINDVLELLREQRVDFTMYFRAMSAVVRDDVHPTRSLFVEPETFDRWLARWQARRACEPVGELMNGDAMDRANPLYIPRNHIVEQVLRAATEGDIEPFNELVDVLTRPFDHRADRERYALPDPSGSAGYQTFCGT